MLKLENAGLSPGASPFLSWEVFLASCPSLGRERQTVGRQRAGECLGKLPGARLSNQASASLAKSCPGPVITGRNVCSACSQGLMTRIEVCARLRAACTAGLQARACPWEKAAAGGEEQECQDLAAILRCVSAPQLCVQIGSETPNPSVCLSLGAGMGYTHAVHTLGNLVMAKRIPLCLQRGLLGVFGAWGGGTPKQGSLSGSTVWARERSGCTAPGTERLVRVAPWGWVLRPSLELGTALTGVGCSPA